MQVVLDMREKELEEKQMEMAKILATLNAQKEKQEQEYYKEFLQSEAKEIDDITSARFRFQ